MLEDPEAPDSGGPRAEARLRNIRALLFSGDDAVARRTIAAWSSPPASHSLDLLRDLAETYARLEAYDMAIDVQRLRSKLVPTGSLAWFDARYGLALAYYHAGKLMGRAPPDRGDLDSSPAILGGGDLRGKFIRCAAADRTERIE